MDVCLPLFSVCVVPCVGSDLATGLSPVQEVLPTLYKINKLKKQPRSTRAVEPQTIAIPNHHGNHSSRPNQPRYVTLMIIMMGIEWRFKLLVHHIL
jgi:hypothetical protein